jgi:hypothetical protein
VPSVLFHVVESTYNPLTVTAEAAGSSPVVPAILFENGIYIGLAAPVVPPRQQSTITPELLNSSTEFLAGKSASGLLLSVPNSCHSRQLPLTLLGETMP